MINYDLIVFDRIIPAFLNDGIYTLPGQMLAVSFPELHHWGIPASAKTFHCL